MSTHEPCTPEEFWGPEEVAVEETPEGVSPTPEQWVAFFLKETPEGRLRAAERVLQNARESLACRFEQNHEQRIAMLTAQVLDLTQRVIRLQDLAGISQILLRNPERL